jgi:peptide/nickel transport system substrate-binding protein
MGMEYFPTGLDPAVNNGIYEVNIYSQIYETLIKIDKDHRTLIPNLAQSWSVSDDNKRFTFTLREGIRFHDGSLLSANDVKFSFLRHIDKNKTSILSEYIDTVNVIDSLTINVILKAEYFQFLFSLTSPFNFVTMSEKAVKKYGDRIAQNPVGTGPFQLKKWKKNDLIELKSNESYWRPTNDVEHIRFILLDSDSQWEQALQKGDVDILYMVSGHLLDRLKWKGRINYFVLDPTSTVFIGFNNITPPFDDIRIRRAILKAINLHKLVINLTRGNSILAEGPLPPALYKYKNIKQSTYNIDEAKVLLNQAGYENGLTVKCYIPKIGIRRQTIILMLQNELAKVGINLEITLFDTWELHDRAIKNSDSQMFIDAYDSDILGDAHYFLHSLFHSKSKTNTLHYSNNFIDQWLDRANRENDYNVRQELYDKVVKQILNDVPAIFLFHVIPHYAYNSDKIKAIAADPYQPIQFHQIVLQ